MSESNIPNQSPRLPRAQVDNKLRNASELAMDLEKTRKDLVDCRILGLFQAQAIALIDRVIAAESELKRLREQTQPESAATDQQEENTNYCALNSITDDQVRKVVRAFWRRIYGYRNDYGRELPSPLPVEFMAHMATALSWVDKFPTHKAQSDDLLLKIKAYLAVDGSMGTFSAIELAHARKDLFSAIAKAVQS